MTAELTSWLVYVVDRPYTELVVVAPRGQLLLIVGPFEPTHFLPMGLQTAERVCLLSQVPLQDRLVFGARTQNTIAPGYATYSSLVSLEHSEEFLLVDVPDLHDAAIRPNREVLSPLAPADGGHGVPGAACQLVKLGHLAIAGGPDIDAIGEADSQVVGRGPVHQIQVEVVLEGRRVEHLVGDL